MINPAATVQGYSETEKLPPMARMGRPATKPFKDPQHRIREMRMARGMSQEDLAGSVHMSLSNVGKIERGEIPLRVSQLKTFADALGCRVPELLPTEHVLSPHEQALLSLFNSLDVDDQDRLMRMGHALKTKPDKALANNH